MMWLLLGAFLGVVASCLIPLVFGVIGYVLRKQFVTLPSKSAAVTVGAVAHRPLRPGWQRPCLVRCGRSVGSMDGWVAPPRV